MVDFASKQEVATGIFEVSPEEVAKRLPQVKIIDVRRPDEFTGELGHIPGAELATLENDFALKIEKMPKNETYVFVCLSGGRSLKATAYAHSLGFESIYNLAGGMRLWSSLGLPKEV